MDRKAVARETLKIMDQGYYEYEGKRIDIQSDMDASIRSSVLITPTQGAELLEKYSRNDSSGIPDERVENLSTVDAIRKLAKEGRSSIGVLNFASAKNPGGGFINGAMAQEESLAASGTLYRTLTAHEEYYRSNRAQTSMMYTDHAIYSPDVTFFRSGNFRLVETPVKASVLTLPAVNMGQVRLKGEDTAEAARVMRRWLFSQKRGQKIWYLAPTAAACSATIRIRSPPGGRSFWQRAWAAALTPFSMRYWIAPEPVSASKLLRLSQSLLSERTESNYGREKKRGPVRGNAEPAAARQL